MTKLLIYYSFILVTLMTFVGFISARTYAEITSAVLFFPLALYFGLLSIPQVSHAFKFPAKSKAPVSKKSTARTAHVPPPTSHTPLPTSKPGLDLDRRAFLKIIGGAGLSLFLFSIFTRRAHGAFFGSGPGTTGPVAIKDSSGTTIDPAFSTPTDGYKISDIDSSSPAYYGFTDKTGRWFVMKEGASGDYRYSKGASSYSTNWSNRASLTYDYFDTVF